MVRESHETFARWLAGAPGRPAPSQRPPDIVRATLGAVRGDLGRLLAMVVVVTAVLTLCDAVVDVVITPHHPVPYLVGQLLSFALDLILVSALAGLFVRSMAARNHGVPNMGWWDVFRAQPYGRLVAADLLSTLLTAVGLAFLIVPGLVVFTLTALTGPVIKIEQRGAVAAITRSWRLVWHRFWTVALLFTVPFGVGEQCGSLLDPLEHVSPAGYYAAAFVVNGAFAGFCGAVLAELALRLIEDTHRVPEASGPSEATGAIGPHLRRRRPASDTER